MPIHKSSSARVAAMLALSAGFVVTDMRIAPVGARELVVAVVAPLNGPRADIGRSIVKAAQFTAAVVNAGGDAAGPKLSLTIVDDPCISGAALDAFEAVAKGPAVAVVGHACAPTAIAAEHQYQTAGKLVMTADSRPRQTRRFGPLSFRMTGDTASQGTFIGQRLASEPADPRARRIAFVSDKTAFATTIVKDAVGVLAAHAITPVAIETYAGGSLDFRPLAQRLAESGATQIVLAGFPAEAAPLMAELLAANPALDLFASDSLATSEFVAVAGPRAGSIRIALPVTVAALAATTPAADRFAAALTEAGIAPTSAALYTSAAIEAVAAAAAESPASPSLPTAAAIATRLADGSTPTLLGPLSFDRGGAATWPSRAWYSWDGQTWRPATRR